MARLTWYDPEDPSVTIIPCPVKNCQNGSGSKAHPRNRRLLRKNISNHIKNRHPGIGLRDRSLLADKAVEGIVSH